MNKEDDSNTSDEDIFETLQIRKSKWTPPEGQFASLDFFSNKCCHDINKLNFNRNTKFSNLSSEERAALENLSKRKDIIVKAAEKGGALVVWRADLYQKEALRQLSDTSFYPKVDKDLPSAKQQIVRSTINDLIVKQELPATATTLIITTPRTLYIYTTHNSSIRSDEGLTLETSADETQLSGFSGSGIRLISRPGFGILKEEGDEIRDCNYDRDLAILTGGTREMSL